jgi:DNA-binding NarL/FixJ family response regulator
MGAKIATAKRARILLVEDHPLMREGIQQRINHEPDLMVCAQASNAHEAIAAIERFNPELAVVDISLPGRDGIDLTKDIRTRFPDLIVIVLSLHDESLYAERALRAGARGYIMKSEPPENLIAAIRRALAGEIAVGNGTVNRLLSRVTGAIRSKWELPLDTLSDRELEIFRLIGAGYQRSHIAAELNLSVKTIESHRANIRKKLGLLNATQLLQKAVHYNQQDDTGFTEIFKPRR